jgi:hypothetical protein
MKTDTVGGPGQKKRVDLHKWEKREALLVIPKWSPGVLGEMPPIARVLRRYEINVCAACGIWCEERPEYIHDLPPCKFAMEEATTNEPTTRLG